MFTQIAEILLVIFLVVSPALVASQVDLDAAPYSDTQHQTMEDR